MRRPTCRPRVTLCQRGDPPPVCKACVRPCLQVGRTTAWLLRMMMHYGSSDPIRSKHGADRCRYDRLRRITPKKQCARKLKTRNPIYTVVSAHDKIFSARKSYFFPACMQHRMSIHQTIPTDHGELLAYWDLQNKIENSKKSKFGSRGHLGIWNTEVPPGAKIWFFWVFDFVLQISICQYCCLMGRKQR